MTNKNRGYIIIAATLLMTFLLWFFSKSLNEIVKFPFSSISSATAFLGTILLSWSMLLSTRLDFLEDWFDGLDKVYIVHKKVGIWGLALIAAHAVTLALERLPNIGRVLAMFLPGHPQKFLDLGIYGFWFFMLFVVMTILRKKIKLPYHIWKFVHKFTGIALFLGFIHILLIPHSSPSFNPLNLWILVTTGIGIASWLYFEFFYKLLTPSYKYEVVEITKDNDIFKISLRAIGEKMSYKTGQFACVSFVNGAVGKEAHPFSMISHQCENEISFAIKILGDYTSTLDKLKTGDMAQIKGPHGTFADKFLETKKDSIFIGGGIGMAPFVSMAKEVSRRKDFGRKVSMFYCTKYKRDACFDEELREISKNSLDCCYLNKCSRENGRLSVIEIVGNISDIKNTLVFICGPTRMSAPLIKSLVAEGVVKQNIVTEEF